MRKIITFLLSLTLALGALCGDLTTVYATETAAETSTEATLTLKESVNKIVSEQVSSTDSKKTKMKKLFKYMEANYVYYGGSTRGFHASSAAKGWQKTFASEMISEKKGSCFHYAALYAYLIKAATGYTVRIGAGKTNGFSGSLQEHAWTEVKIGKTWYVCDVNLDQYGKGTKCSLKYFLKTRTKLKSTYNKYKGATYITVKL